MSIQVSNTISFKILTIYPELFSSFLSHGLIGKAVDEKILNVELIDFRKYGIGKHRKVDAPPYGGGAGMVLRPEPIFSTLAELEKENSQTGIHKILISPQGKLFNQNKAWELSKIEQPIALICGRFEGFDERIRSFADEEISIGDFVMMGGELVAMAIVESVGRLVPQVIGNQDSLDSESFSHGLLEYAQYTRPENFEGMSVPNVLRSGNHQEIAKWRTENAISKTRKNRPDLYEKLVSAKTNE